MKKNPVSNFLDAISRFFKSIPKATYMKIFMGIFVLSFFVSLVNVIFSPSYYHILVVDGEPLINNPLVRVVIETILLPIGLLIGCLGLAIGLSIGLLAVVIGTSPIWSPFVLLFLLIKKSVSRNK